MSRPLSLGITCYPSIGGSGIVATQIGMAMAARGHQVHFICAAAPHLLDPAQGNVFVHEVSARDYHVFQQVPYALALSSAMVDVATHEGLDVLHAHYAVPHATSAWMAREVLGNGLKVVTTLHGTDITLIGSDPSYLPITRHSILKSDAVTTPSDSLRRETFERFDLDPAVTPIEVIPNFVDTEALHPDRAGRRERLAALFGAAAREVPVLVHVSNFRPLKRVDRVVEVFARVARDRPCLLLLVGDGPARPEVEAQVRDLGLQGRVRLIGTQDRFVDLLAGCAVFLLPSEAESFGLAALEALACGVPVVCSDVGGLPEVVRDGETGFLVAPDDVATMARRVGHLLDQPEARAEMSRAARADVLDRFQTGPRVDRYEALYQRLVDGEG